jgi:hypothetical protein
MTWKTMDDPPDPTCMVLFFGRHKTSNLRHYEVGTVDPAWGCVEIIPTHWMSLPSPPGIADQPDAVPTPREHLLMDLLAETYEYIDADASEQPPFMARIREALGVGDRPADQQSAADDVQYCECSAPVPREPAGSSLEWCNVCGFDIRADKPSADEPEAHRQQGYYQSQRE